MVTAMKKILVLLLAIPAFAFSAQSAPKQTYALSKTGTIKKNPTSLLDDILLSSSLDSIIEETENQITANRKVEVSSPDLSTKGKVLEKVEVSKPVIREYSKGILKNGLKSNVYSIAAQFLAAYAMSKGWEWIEAQRAWLKNEPTFPSVNCRVTKVLANGQPTNITLSNTTPDACVSIFLAQLPSSVKISSNKKFVNTPTTTTYSITTSDIYSPSFQIVAVTTGALLNNKTPVTEEELNGAIDSTIKGKERTILEGDINNQIKLPYFSEEGFLKDGNIPAVSTPTVVSTTTKTNPDATTETTTVTEQKTYDYKQPSSDGSFSPSVTTTTTTTTINNTTNQTTTNVKNEYKTPEKVKEEDKKEAQEKEEEKPPVAPESEFPEIPPPELSNEKLPQLVAPTIMGFPTIPTSFTCTNPDFDMGLWKTTLPMCDWIERFRALFEWFWMMSTAVAIYVIARGTNLNDGK